MAVAITRTEPDAARRMLALALVLDGRNRADAARSCGMDRQTLRDWVHRFNESGLSDRKAPGPTPRLTAEQDAAVADLVRRGSDLAEHGVVRWRRADLSKVIEARFGVQLGLWSFGADSVADFVAKAKPYTIEVVAEQIRCPCLVLEGEGDIFFKGQPQQVFDALKAPKQLFAFTSEDGAENHCRSGALSYLHEVVFNWLDKTMKLHDGNGN